MVVEEEDVVLIDLGAASEQTRGGTSDELEFDDPQM